MKQKIILGILAGIFTPVIALANLPFVGIYQTIDDETNNPKSIVALYEHQDKLAGRIIALYDAEGKISDTPSNPIRVADQVDGQPKYVGLDIIWNMTWDADDDEYTGGKIMDPKSGKIYSSVIWQDADKTKLQVRGKIGPFGRTQTWNVINVSDLPVELQNINTTDWQPVIRK